MRYTVKTAHRRTHSSLRLTVVSPALTNLYVTMVSTTIPHKIIGTTVFAGIIGLEACLEFVLGIVPMVIATAAGAAGRQSIDTGVLTTSALLALFFTRLTRGRGYATQAHESLREERA
jgi:hypothetical protein